MTRKQRIIVECKNNYHVDSLQGSDWQRAYNEGLDTAISIFKRINGEPLSKEEIEWAAKAILQEQESSGCIPYAHYEGLDKHNKRYLLDLAKAALQAFMGESEGSE